VGGRDPGTPAAIIQDASTDSQRVLRGTLGSIAADAKAAGIRPPATTVIGEVVTTLE
jgi:uroporphyrin-III C-methyltransferase/precorrin-2 dehydrogenase/sirohydrochlorin ferrochelatase